MALAKVQHTSAHGSGSGSAPGSVTLGSTPTVGNVVIAFVGVNIGETSVTLANGWKPFGHAASDTRAGMVTMGLYRYVQSGDTTALPAFASAGSTYWCASVYEISGVTGTWATDCQSVTSRYDSGSVSSSTTPNARTMVANCLVLTGFSQYNGGSVPTISSGWTLDEAATNNSNYGSYGCASQSVSSSGTVLQSTVSWGGSSGPAGSIQLVLAPSTPSHGTIRQTRVLSGVSGTLNLHMDPIPGNLLLVFLSWGNGGSSAPTVGSSWTTFASALNGSNPQMLGMYRYVQSGDTAALPTLITSGSAFSSVTVHEITGGLTGTFATDVSSSAQARQASGATQVTSSLSAGADSLVLISASNYDGSGPISFSSGWNIVDEAVNFGNYGAYAAVQQYFTSASSATATITENQSGQPAAYMAVVIGVGASLPTTMGVTQVGLEVWVQETAILEVTQIGLEVWVQNSPVTEFTQVGLEVWRTTDDGQTVMSVTQIGIEVWEFLDYVPPPATGGVIIIIMGG